MSTVFLHTVKSDRQKHWPITTAENECQIWKSNLPSISIFSFLSPHSQVEFYMKWNFAVFLRVKQYDINIAKSKENDYDDFVIEALGTAVIGSGCPGGASGGTGRLSLTAKWTQNIKFLKIYSKFSRIFYFFFTCNCINIPIGRT